MVFSRKEAQQRYRARLKSNPDLTEFKMFIPRKHRKLCSALARSVDIYCKGIDFYRKGDGSLQIIQHDTKRTKDIEDIDLFMRLLLKIILLYREDGRVYLKNDKLIYVRGDDNVVDTFSDDDNYWDFAAFLYKPTKKEQQIPIIDRIMKLISKRRGTYERKYIRPAYEEK